MKRNILLSAALSIFGVGIVALSARAVDVAAQAAPATQPAGDPSALTRQLGDDDFHVRQEAARQLKALGKAAVPALQEARKSQDPEVHARAEELLQEIDRPPVLPVPHPVSGGNFAATSSIRVSIVNGAKTIDASEPGRTVHIDEGKDGIAMKVTGQIDGKEVTRDYKAKNADELKKDNPEAFALYQQYAGDGAQQGQIQFQGGRVIINGNARLNIQGGAIAIGPNGVILPPGGNVVIPPGLIQPVPIPAIPAGPRLGIAAAEETKPGDGLTVLQVVPDSRAEKMGLKEKDAIQKVNGKEIHTVEELRKAIADNPKGGLVIEGTRDGRAIKLEEKAEL